MSTVLIAPSLNVHTNYLKIVCPAPNTFQPFLYFGTGFEPQRPTPYSSLAVHSNHPRIFSWCPCSQLEMWFSIQLGELRPPLVDVSLDFCE